jgi:hypothetical protein
MPMTLITLMTGPAHEFQVNSTTNVVLKSTIPVGGITMWQPHLIQPNRLHIHMDPASRVDFCNNHRGLLDLWTIFHFSYLLI